MVSKASEDFPDPDKPVNTTNLSFGMSTDIFFRLWVLAPLIEICFFAIPVTLLLLSIQVQDHEALLHVRNLARVLLASFHFPFFQLAFVFLSCSFP